MPQILRGTAAVGGLLALSGMALLFAEGTADTFLSGPNTMLLGLALFFAVVVWLAAHHEPRNPVTWTMASATLFGGWWVSGLSIASVQGSNPEAILRNAELLVPADLPTSLAWMLVFTEPGAVLASFPLLTFGLLLFPDGSLPTPRWRWVGWLAAVSIATVAIVYGAGFRPTRTVPAAQSQLLDFAFIGALAAVALSLSALAVRYRRMDRVARQQIKWVVWGAAVLGPMLIIAVSLGGTRYENLTVVPLVVATGAFIASYGTAILKYRLYEIDVIVNRSVTYGVLAVAIGGLYVGIVVGLGVLFTENATGVSIVATVMVAMAFQPLRQRVQRWANRLVYGERATPYEVLAGFSRRSAELSHEELMERIPKLIVDGTGAESAAVWIRSSHGFGVASAWPPEDQGRLLDGVEAFADPDADYSLPVFHNGELLGGLSLAKVRSESISPTDEALLSDLAGAMGLALRNAALTSELRQQVAELEASRERILAAADQARRDLERHLDSGPQQRLVALKVKLGPIRKVAERAGAEKTASVLAQLETEAGAAIQAVRDFAGGVYPPLLEAEGLAVAITQQARKAAFPVSVHGDGVGRYERDVEAAVYFAVLEALQNTAKYSNATSASVTLADGGEGLGFEVRDDGDGFDPAQVERGAGLDGMADRLDTVGGRVRITSRPGEGTVVSGSVPVNALVPV